MGLATAVALLSRAGTVVEVGRQVVDFITGQTRSVQGVTAAQAALLSGGTAGPTLSTGTSVGPGTPAFIAAGFNGGAVGGLIAPAGRLAGTLIRRVAGPAAVVGAIGQFIGGGDGGGGAPSRRQGILAQARANSPGATSKKIIRAAKDCGIELAAATFGLDILDVCFLLAQPVSRRSRGISAADMRRTRSTIRKVTTIQRQLKDLSGPLRRRK